MPAVPWYLQQNPLQFFSLSKCFMGNWKISTPKCWGFNNCHSTHQDTQEDCWCLSASETLTGWELMIETSPASPLGLVVVQKKHHDLVIAGIRNDEFDYSLTFWSVWYFPSIQLPGGWTTHLKNICWSIEIWIISQRFDGKITSLWNQHLEKRGKGFLSHGFFTCFARKMHLHICVRPPAVRPELVNKAWWKPNISQMSLAQQNFWPFANQCSTATCLEAHHVILRLALFHSKKL